MVMLNRVRLNYAATPRISLMGACLFCGFRNWAYSSGGLIRGGGRA